MGAFDDKVVIVTGGAQGMGRTTAIAFAAEGARVTIGDVNAAAGQSAVAAIEQAGSQGHLVVGDVSRADVCERVVRETVDRFGQVDVLFNNVGIQPQDSYTNVEN